MSIFRSASDYSWHFVIFVYLASVGLCAYELGLDLIPHSWTIPSEAGLTTAIGRFKPTKANVKSPYTFVTNSGETILLGCLPDSAMADCLDNKLLSLSQTQTQVGYFHSQNWRSPSLSNVLVTISTNGTVLLSYDQSRQNLEFWAVREEQIKHSPLSLGSDVLLPGMLFAFALWLTTRKLEQAGEYDV